MHKVKNIAGKIRAPDKQASANGINTMVENNLDPDWMKQRLQREWTWAEHTEQELMTVMEERDAAQDQIKTLQAAVDRFSRMLLKANKEMCRLKAEADASRDALTATEHQLKMATDWLQQGANQLEAGTEMTVSLQEKYHEVLRMHTSLVKLLEDAVPKAGRVVEFLSTHVPHSMQQGRMTAECVSGVCQAVELLKAFASMQSTAAVSPMSGNAKSSKNTLTAHKRTTSSAAAVPLPHGQLAEGYTTPLAAMPAPPTDTAEEPWSALFKAEAGNDHRLPAVAAKLSRRKNSLGKDTASSVQDLLSSLVGGDTPRSPPDAAAVLSSNPLKSLQHHTSQNLGKSILSQALQRPARSEQHNGSSNGFPGRVGSFSSQWAQRAPDSCTHDNLTGTPSPRTAAQETAPRDIPATQHMPLKSTSFKCPSEGYAAQETSQVSTAAPAATCNAATSKATGTARNAVGAPNPLCSLGYASLATGGNNDQFMSCGNGNGLFTSEALYTCASMYGYPTGSWAWWQCLLGGACSIALDSCMQSKTTIRTVAVLMAALVLVWTLLCLRVM